MRADYTRLGVTIPALSGVEGPGSTRLAVLHLLARHVQRNSLGNLERLGEAREAGGSRGERGDGGAAVERRALGGPVEMEGVLLKGNHPPARWSPGGPAPLLVLAEPSARGRAGPQPMSDLGPGGPRPSCPGDPRAAPPPRRDPAQQSEGCSGSKFGRAPAR